MSVGEQMERLVGIMDELREKCPWDRKQTLDSLRPLTIEELYELVDAIREKDWKGMAEELGDVMLHVVFYARIAAEEQKFTMENVLRNICEKLIFRHPHVYGDTQVKDEEEVKKNWEQLKLREGKRSALSGVPDALPALIKAWRMQDKARKSGFDWDKKEDVWQKIQEELQELQDAEKAENPAEIEAELGDVLFSIINYARFLNIDPEEALEKTNRKFRYRFMKMEAVAADQQRQLSDMTLTEMDAIWNTIKKETT